MYYLSIEKKIIKLRYKVIIVNLILSTILFLLIIANNETQNYKQMVVYSFWLAFSYGLLLWSESRCNGLNILTIYIFGCFMRLVYPTYSMATLALKGEYLYYIMPYNNILDVIYPTCISMNIAYMLFLLSFTYFSKGWIPLIDMKSLFKQYNIFYLCLFLYILLITIRVYPNITSISDTISSWASKLGQVVLLILAFYCAYKKKRGKEYYLFISIIIIECIYGIFWGFFKSGIILPIIFYLLHYYLYSKNNHKKIISLNSIIIIGVIYCFLIFFVYPFMNTKRAMSGFIVNAEGGYETTKEYSNIQILEDMFNGKEEKNIKELNEAASDRQNAITPNAFFYKKTNEIGYNNEIIIKSLKMAIPKVIDPNKPLNDIGLIATSYVITGNSKNAKYMTSSTYIGFFSSSYFVGGWHFVIIATLFLGFILSKILRFAIKNIKNIMSVLLTFIISFDSLTSFEETCNSYITQTSLYCYLVLFIIITNKLLYLYWHRK